MAARRCGSVKKHFNSHTREGVTQERLAMFVEIANFNSHTREGVTKTTKANVITPWISTHTPVRV